MHVDLTCYHWNGEITIAFRLDSPDEEAFGFNFGSSPEEIKGNYIGWFTKESEVHGKRYKIDKSKPYISLYKKLKDGSKVKSNEPINVIAAFDGANPPTPESLTTTSFDF